MHKWATEINSREMILFYSVPKWKKDTAGLIRGCQRRQDENVTFQAAVSDTMV